MRAVRTIIPAFLCLFQHCIPIHKSASCNSYVRNVPMYIEATQTSNNRLRDSQEHQRHRSQVRKDTVSELNRHFHRIRRRITRCIRIRHSQPIRRIPPQRPKHRDLPLQLLVPLPLLVQPPLDNSHPVVWNHCGGTGLITSSDHGEWFVNQRGFCRVGVPTSEHR